MASSGGQYPATVSLTGGQGNPTGPLGGSVIFVTRNGTTDDPVNAMSNLVDGGTGGAVVATGLMAMVSGSAYDRLRTPKVFTVVSTLAVGTEATIWTPTTGKKFRLMGLALALSAATTLTLRDNTAGTVIFRLLLPAGGPGIHAALSNGILSAAANNVLTATSGAAANLDGTVWGTEE